MARVEARLTTSRPDPPEALVLVTKGTASRSQVRGHGVYGMYTGGAGKSNHVKTMTVWWRETDGVI